MAEADVRRLDNAASWLAYASALRARKQDAQAVEAAQKAVERDPKGLHPQYEMAQALVAAGRLPEAAGPLQRVVAVNRSYDSDLALFTLARAQLAANDPAAAHATLEEIAGRSSRPEFLHEHARVLAGLGRRDEAARVLQRIISEAELVPAYLQRDVKPWVRKSRQGLRALGF
jgi:tetratricopeptide (TPR) repeat protein